MKGAVMSRRTRAWGLVVAAVLCTMVADGQTAQAQDRERRTPDFVGGLDPQGLWPFGRGGAFLGHVTQKSDSEIEVRSFDWRWTVQFVLPRAGEGDDRAARASRDTRDALEAQIRNTLVGEFVEVQWRMVDDQPTLRAIIRAR